MSSTKGQFINFLLDFKKLSEEGQAKAILDKARVIIATGVKGVSITYSANYGQTVTIESTYLKGEWNTKTNGINQAEVMRQMLSLMNTSYKDLQGKMQIAPITTMPGGTIYGKLFDDDQFHLGIVVSDIVRIQNHLDAVWTILGWQNQDTVSNAKHPYAIGGGVVSSMPVVIEDMIQDSLIRLHKDYT